MTARRSRSILAPVALAAVLVLVAACTAGAPAALAPSSVAPSPVAPTVAPSEPGPTMVPGGPVSSAPGSVDGAGPAPSAPDTPVAGGPVVGGPIAGGGSGAAPGEPQPTIVTPGVGLTNIHPVGATKLETAINGRDLAVRVDWYSGVEPCSVLAGVDVARDGTTFKLTVREGSAAAPDTACIDIAMYTATIVDLGDLDPGTYTVTAFGDAPAVTVTID